MIAEAAQLEKEREEYEKEQARLERMREEKALLLKEEEERRKVEICLAWKQMWMNKLVFTAVPCDKDLLISLCKFLILAVCLM